ncbi:hypothetical protein D1K53_10550 [Salmonella enterica]|uniref:Uncharacterized protein n=1 Tax=Salmonella enterica TaxID=28901 RepID=A0A5U1Q5S7_SALER|nr:hypothetical protein [Salmonella enterica subsp. arizonae]EAM4315222.1 hypothetical protein [Salmonella enterica]EAN5161108.1 hypothetical protein [Salmonella enterica]EAO9822178.1 hypothetical protein [Salmonella enterica]EBL7091663.1 hypothetical protein [Salmonella enterica]
MIHHNNRLNIQKSLTDFYAKKHAKFALIMLKKRQERFSTRLYAATDDIQNIAENLQKTIYYNTLI